jgi:hypothetical protein
MPPPPRPCRIRKSRSESKVQAKPHKTELAVNSARHTRKKVLRPSARARKLLAVKATAFATR